jgi:hypothetical protein
MTETSVMASMRRSSARMKLHNLKTTNRISIFKRIAEMLCLNTLFTNEGVVSYVTSHKLQNVKGARRSFDASRGLARTDVSFRSVRIFPQINCALHLENNRSEKSPMSVYIYFASSCRYYGKGTPC